MKKLSFLIIFITLFIWMIWRSNYFAANFRTETFYHPIFLENFDVLQKGASVQATLINSFNVEYGFFLVLPCNNPAIEPFTNLDGIIEYKLIAKGKTLTSKRISPPSRPVFGKNHNECSLLLFPIRFPNSFLNSKVELEVTVIYPITKLEMLRNNIKCKVSPAYWPK